MLTGVLAEAVNSQTKTISSESTHFLPFEQKLSRKPAGFLQNRLRSWLTRSALEFRKFQAASLACTFCAFFVLVLNLSMFAWATTHSGFPSTGRQRLYQGSCETATRMSAGFHVFINISSTLLVSCSGFCMQYLSAPTRDEVSRAHARGKWLDVGILSMGNLLSIEKKRVVLWVVLAITSLPLHLL